jgi:hypothetical protein
MVSAHIRERIGYPVNTIHLHFQSKQIQAPSALFVANLFVELMSTARRDKVVRMLT